jgi:hypothetical protein
MATYRCSADEDGQRQLLARHLTRDEAQCRHRDGDSAQVDRGQALLCDDDRMELGGQIGSDLDCSTKSTGGPERHRPQ